MSCKTSCSAGRPIASISPPRNAANDQSLISITLTALTATRTLSPTLSLSSSSESSVMTDSIVAPPAMRTLTWHMTVPRLISVTSPSRRFRAPISMSSLRNEELPGKRPVFVEDAAGGPVGCECRQLNRCRRALLHGPRAAVMIHVGRRVARIGGIHFDPGVFQVGRELDGDRIDSGLRRVVSQEFFVGVRPSRIALLGQRAEPARQIDDPPPGGF